MTDYRVLRSGRKTLAIEVRPEGTLVRAPYAVTPAQIEAFVQSKSDWIARTRKKLEAAAKPVPVEDRLSANDIRDLAKRAMLIIPQRVAYYAKKIGVTYGRITIRNQKSRWGSCSDRGNLNFNCLLMLTPPEVIDSIVVHELCHRKHMNHSEAFYSEVLRVFPDYWKWNKWLKSHEKALMRRMTG